MDINKSSMDLKTLFKGKNLLSFFGNLWKKIYKIFFFFLILCAFAIGGYIWQQNLNSNWNAAQKMEFMSTQDKGVVFREKDYDNALEVVRQRKEQGAKIPDVQKDFFKPY